MISLSLTSSASASANTIIVVDCRTDHDLAPLEFAELKRRFHQAQQSFSNNYSRAFRQTDRRYWNSRAYVGLVVDWGDVVTRFGSVAFLFREAVHHVLQLFSGASGPTALCRRVAPRSWSARNFCLQG